jgi:chromate transport protein ChrA
MTDTEFLNAVARGQLTPGPVLSTVAAVGYAAHGLAGGMLAAAVAFAAVALLVIGRGIVETLLLAGVAGVVLALAGAPLP